MNRNMKCDRIISLLVMIIMVIGVIGCTPQIVNAETYLVSNNSSITVYKGEKIKLKIGNNTGSYEWKSSNKKVATVDDKGKVVAKKKGTATISVEINGKKYKYKIIVKEKVNLKKGFYCGEFESGAQMRLAVKKISEEKLTFEMAYCGNYERGSTEMSAKIVGNKVTFQMKGDLDYEGKCTLKLHKDYVTYTNGNGYSMKLSYVNNNADVWQLY